MRSAAELIDDRVLRACGPQTWQKMTKLADENVPISWETIEDKGLFTLFKCLPTHEDLKGILRSRIEREDDSSTAAEEQNG